MPGNVATITPGDRSTWPTPNYIDPVQRTWLPAYDGVLYAISTCMIAARLWLRVNKKAGGLGLDDALLFVAWLGSTMITVVQSIGVAEFHIGRHIWDEPEALMEKVLETSWLAEFAFVVATGCTKISILLFYRRIVDGTHSRRYRWLVIGAIIFTATWSLILVLFLVLNCNPTEAYWKAYDPTYDTKYTCMPTQAINLVAGILAIVSDLYSVILPFVVTRRCQFTRQQRLALNAVFSGGLFVAVVSSVRTYYLWEVGVDADVSWLMYDVFIWAELEVQLGLMFTAAPALRVLFGKVSAVASRLKTSSQRSHDPPEVSSPQDFRRLDDREAQLASADPVWEKSRQSFEFTLTKATSTPRTSQETETTKDISEYETCDLGKREMSRQTTAESEKRIYH